MRTKNLIHAVFLLGVIWCCTNDQKQSAPPSLQDSFYAPLVDSILYKSDVNYKIMSTRGMGFYYVQNTFPERQLGTLIKDAAQSLEHCVSLLGMKEAPEIKIIYFDAREKLRPFINMAPKGIALPDAYTLLLVANDSTRAYHTHEMMHVLSWHSFGGYAATPADWIQEGFSVYADNPCLGYPVHAIAAYFYHTKQLIPLQKMIYEFRSLSDMHAYMQVGSVVAFIIHEFGLEKLALLWKRGADQFEMVTGMTLLDFERAYIQFLLKEYPVKPDVDWILLSEKGCG